MQPLINQVIDQIDQVLLGKDQQVRLALACLFARGHLLIEDLPGMGKTTLAHCLAKVLGLEFERVQFTSDLLPADILGVAIFEKNEGVFKFHPGPVFTQVLLADEINRSSPKTQSALLEAMEEGQVTIEGKSRPLPTPFFVIATQNPLSQSGTFPLPESQLDRFLMRISLGYPSPASERLLFEGVDPRARIRAMEPLVNKDQLATIQHQVHQVKASPALLDYVQRLVAFTRTDGQFSYGLSPRGALALVGAAKAWAYIHHRDYLIPEDVQAVLPSVVSHRVRGTGHSSQGEPLVQRLRESVDVLG
ncbi:AAA family ATPase [Cellvibrio japonicus]|uniref:MoxR protein n=1 Tax=Cellvibrio japonicus (strain Ueda107) TaxID=498211 RepID=B3PBW4_CELJU|nr:MoxR family ATPase [Cellvibrio japonicus]ACE84859.1 MoxR protein [Cellvibrio japonicus Ueda107]QEI11780.1 MoxR family ATPase [Cellvibrio japonicus]QEI15354.1 MoxR family ATPase [Cellvibrio japonicus]QEI18933.1 MoxR family ATPase [Cellvibrio japonicus]